jgi:hypothetical protein
MRHVRTWAAMLLAVVSMAGCTDTPTAPESGGIGAGKPDPSSTYILPGVIVIGECDPYTSADFCKSTCITSTPGEVIDPESITVSSCPGTGGGSGVGGNGGGWGGDGGGGQEPQDPVCPDYGCDPPPPDTCKTGEQVVDAPHVWGGFQELWLESKLKGVEKGGWIILDGSYSFRLIPFQNATFTPCGIDVYEPAPVGTVSIVHTHPWPMWSTTPCGYVNTGTPSQEDVNALQRTGLSTGYFLDENGIGKFTSSGAQAATRINRCGY